MYCCLPAGKRTALVAATGPLPVQRRLRLCEKARPVLRRPSRGAGSRRIRLRSFRPQCEAAGQDDPQGA